MPLEIPGKLCFYIGSWHLEIDNRLEVGGSTRERKAGCFTRICWLWDSGQREQKLQQVVCYRIGHENGKLRVWRERWRSAVSLSAALPVGSREFMPDIVTSTWFILQVKLWLSFFIGLLGFSISASFQLEFTSMFFIWWIQFTDPRLHLSFHSALCFLYLGITLCLFF